MRRLPLDGLALAAPFLAIGGALAPRSPLPPLAGPLAGLAAGLAPAAAGLPACAAGLPGGTAGLPGAACGRGAGGFAPAAGLLACAPGGRGFFGGVGSFGIAIRGAPQLKSQIPNLKRALTATDARGPT